MPENIKTIELDQGGGGEKSSQLISIIRKTLAVKGAWKNTGDDGAIYDLGGKKLVFTTDGFIVDPIFFPGGDIGKIAMCGTINDLCVMGATPIGISLSLIIEEGFPEKDLITIIKSINEVSKQTGVPIVTGDTKVTERGKLDKIEITTAGVGLASKVIDNAGARVGDLIIASGNLGDHTVALLSKRFDYRTKIKSDCRPFIKELASVGKYLTSAKDPTRGGVAAVLNEMADKAKARFVLDEATLPFGKEAVALSELLGIDKFSFPSEGRFVATVSQRDAGKVLTPLKKFNKEAKVIGRVEKGRGVFLKTSLGSEKRIETPRGKLIPRIC
ncbi:hydrogenase expression/formation protein HypE [Candidatus Falkowbacteria bacterium]|nr:hydrogenase expression/formation protein HypE [Candidatus Falkowbacteria bacterium]